MRSNYTFYSYADAEMTFPTCAEFASYMNSSLAECVPWVESRTAMRLSIVVCKGALIMLVGRAFALTQSIRSVAGRPIDVVL